MCYAAAQLQQAAAKGQAAGEAALARVVGQLVRSSPKKVRLPKRGKMRGRRRSGARGAGDAAAAIARAARIAQLPRNWTVQWRVDPVVRYQGRNAANGPHS